MKASIRSNPWRLKRHPGKILVMRFQALGDTVITLPYLQSLKRQYPDIELHFLTRKEVSAIPKHVGLFSKVIEIGGGRNAKIQFLLGLLKLPQLWFSQYDAVLDLQNNRISRILRFLLLTRAWVEFDRTSPIAAGERTRLTIEALWTWKVEIDPGFPSIPSEDETLITNGLMPHHQLILLNPAGFCASRNWPLEYYIEFAKLWRREVDPKTQFLLLLLPHHKDKAAYIKDSLGEYCVDLTGKADQRIAFSIIKKCSLVLSEDSGLMHMAWVQGVPTIALFSSSRKDWSAPLGRWSYCFDSSDLECGPCLLEVCKYNDNRCLTRYTPEIVLMKAQELHGKW